MEEEHTSLREILKLLADEKIKRYKEFCMCLIFIFLLSCLQGYINYVQIKRLNEHKKAIIELTNKHNATINYLKAKEHEKNKKE